MKWINKVIEFLKNGIWETDNKGNKKLGWALRPFRIIIYTIKSAGKHEVALRSAALTIYTVMSLVPVAALIFGILKGFGFEKNLTEYLYSTFKDYSNVLDVVMDFVNRMLIKTSGGAIAAVGVIVLLWSVIKMFGNIEDAFNSIWEVRKPRAITRKFSDYITVIFIAPILLVASISLGTFIRDFLSGWGIDWLVDILLWFTSVVLIWLLFAFIYWLMPNTTVKFKGAAIAAMIAGTAFYIFSVVYFFIQGSLSSYNAIYGTFAAIPLFLSWMVTSWQILLIGGEMSFAYQNIDRYEQERFAANMDNNHKRKALLATMLVIVNHYVEDRGAVNSEEIAVELNLPVRVVRDMIYCLERGGLVVPVQNKKDNKTESYIPARDAHSIRVSEVIESMEKTSTEPDFGSMPEMQQVSALVDDMGSRLYDPKLNLYLADLVKK